MSFDPRINQRLTELGNMSTLVSRVSETDELDGVEASVVAESADSVVCRVAVSMVERRRQVINTDWTCCAHYTIEIEVDLLRHFFGWQR